MFARNSDLYLEDRASCSAFSSSATRAASTSEFFCSTFLFCSARSEAFSSSSSLTCCSSSCCSLRASSEALRVRACDSSSELVRRSSSCCDWSSCDWLCSSWVSFCDCSSSSSVRMLAVIMLITTPTLSVSWSRKTWWMSEKGRKEASSTTARTSPSKRTGRTMMLRGGASPSPELIWM